MTNANSGDDPEFLANTPASAESLMYSLEQAAEGIGRYFKWQVSKVSRPVHIHRQQYLIN